MGQRRIVRASVVRGAALAGVACMCVGWRRGRGFREVPQVVV
jgi:hypothetical protein